MMDTRIIDLFTKDEQETFANCLHGCKDMTLAQFRTNPWPILTEYNNKNEKETTQMIQRIHKVIEGVLKYCDSPFTKSYCTAGLPAMCESSIVEKQCSIGAFRISPTTVMVQVENQACKQSGTPIISAISVTSATSAISQPETHRCGLDTLIKDIFTPNEQRNLRRIMQIYGSWSLVLHKQYKIPNIADDIDLKFVLARVDQVIAAIQKERESNNFHINGWAVTVPAYSKTIFYGCTSTINFLIPNAVQVTPTTVVVVINLSSPPSAPTTQSTTPNPDTSTSSSSASSSSAYGLDVLVNDLFTKEEQDVYQCSIHYNKGITLREYTKKDLCNKQFSDRVLKVIEEISKHGNSSCFSFHLPKLPGVVYTHDFRPQDTNAIAILNTCCPQGMDVKICINMKPQNPSSTTTSASTAPTPEPEPQTTPKSDTPPRYLLDTLICDVFTDDEKGTLNHELKEYNGKSLRDYKPNKSNTFVAHNKLHVIFRIEEILHKLEQVILFKRGIEFLEMNVADMQSVCYDKKHTSPATSTANAVFCKSKNCVTVHLLVNPVWDVIPANQLPQPSTPIPASPAILHGISLAAEVTNDNVHVVNLSCRQLDERNMEAIYFEVTKTYDATWMTKQVAIFLDCNNFSTAVFAMPRFLHLLKHRCVRYVTLRNQQHMTSDQMLETVHKGYSAEVRDKFIFLEKKEVCKPAAWMPEPIRNTFNVHCKFYLLEPMR